MIERIRTVLSWTQTALLLPVALIATVSLPIQAGTYTFDLLPTNGMVAGPPGSTVGWGYSITNQSTTDWLVTTALNSDPFLFGTSTLLFDFPDLAPGTTAIEPFDVTAGTGVYQLIWDPTAPLEFANFGTFTLSAEWWTGDPLNGGVFLQDALDTAQAYFASVSETSAVPEPSTIVLVSSIFMLISYRFGKRAASNREGLRLSQILGQFYLVLGRIYSPA